MATSQICRGSALNLSSLVPAQALQNDSGCRSSSCIASCMSDLRLSRPVARNAGKETVNAKRWGSCIVLSGRFRECLVAGSLQQRPASLRHTCTRASKDGLEEVEFEWRGEAGKVLLTGSFLDWDKNVALESAGDGVFKVKQSLPPGSHQYKFLVDGKWQHREDLDTVPDGIGGVNNQVVVAEPKTPSKSEAKGKDTERSTPKAKETAQKPLEEKGTAREEEASPQREPTQPATPTPDELQAIAVKAPPPGEKPEPIEKTVAKVTGKDDEKKAPEKKSSDEPKAAKPAAKKADSQPKDSDSPAPKPKAAPRPKAKAAAASEEGENGAPTADAAPTPKAKPAPKAKAAGKAAGKKAGKAPAKPLNELMQEDVVPLLAAELEKENVTDVELVWENNELRGCFVNGGVPYCFWAFFPDGKLEGSRGFSITSHGYPPSTIEPFFVDERPQGMTPQMMVFWIRKRLFAQKSALPRLN